LKTVIFRQGEKGLVFGGVVPSVAAPKMELTEKVGRGGRRWNAPLPRLEGYPREIQAPLLVCSMCYFDSMTKDNEGALPAEFQNLSNLRHSLLRLHKLLLDAERASYEAKHGGQTSVQMLQLVIENEQFAWLRMISELIVRIDEFLDGEEPPTTADASALRQETRDLLRPLTTGNAFQVKYDAALQGDVDVIFAHREIQEILGRDKPRAASS
jgi:hypothetical protein